jgi:hypothetical protein
VSPPAIAWQRLLTMEIPQLHALKSILHRLPYRTLSTDILYGNSTQNSASILLRSQVLYNPTLNEAHIKYLKNN